jgi:DNA-binding PadR family transcriptional regulator
MNAARMFRKGCAEPNTGAERLSAQSRTHIDERKGRHTMDHDRPPFGGGPRHGRGERHWPPHMWRDMPRDFAEDFDRGGRGGGGRDRVERGALRYVLLDALRDGPKHGYEIIKSLEERTGGAYAPSPGTVYPTLQYLEDLGLIRPEQVDERRVFALTEAGTGELTAHAEIVDRFWSRFTARESMGASGAEVGFVRDEFNDLMRTIWGGVRSAAMRGDHEAIRNVRLALERCKSEVREIITRGAAGTPGNGPEGQQ